MRNPAREEEQGCGGRQVGWLCIPCSIPEVHTNVVQCHKDHHQTAQEIDGFDPVVFCIGFCISPLHARCEGSYQLS